MGGSGGSYFPHASDNLTELVRQSKAEADKARLDADVNNLLRQVIPSFQRDPETEQEYLDSIRNALGVEIEMLNFLFGGSVAKHTYVDGLSDVDSLVILNQEHYAGKTPNEVLEAFHSALRDNLNEGNVASIDKGRLAVTIRFRDGKEIQLLPALRTGETILISNATGDKWKETAPKKFQKSLTSVNKRLNGMLIGVIKLFKSLNSGLAKQSQLTGYHIESLAVDAVKGYRKNKTYKELLLHVLDSASRRVLSPIADVTGQSRIVDEYLGPANSGKRRLASNTLSGVLRKLSSAKTSEDWRKVLID
jgi:hypothetical protein